MKTKQTFTHPPIDGKTLSRRLPEGTALVLEGGGLRGFFSAGVFEAFMDADILFPYVIAVSAGAANVLSYISGQPGRNRQVVEYYVGDKRYVSKRNMIRHRSMFGMDFVFHEVPQRHVVWDYEAFRRQNTRFFAGALDCETGKTVWFDNNDIDLNIEPIIASCSIPILSPIRPFKGYRLLDGGVSDPIPIEKSIDDGNTFHVVILTRNQGYQQQEFKHSWFLSLVYRKYPKVVETIRARHEVYNRQLALCEHLEKEGKAVIIRPQNPINVGRSGAKTSILLDLYDEGHEEGKANLDSILKSVNSKFHLEITSPADPQ